MLKLINNEIINDSVYDTMIEKLENKLALFDYINKEDFIEYLKQDKFLIYVSDHAIFHCEIMLYSSGLKGLTVSVVKLSDSKDEMAHLRECLSLIEIEAKRLGFDRTILEGRIGWKKVFPEYNVEKIVLTKDLNIKE